MISFVLRPRRRHLMLMLPVMVGCFLGGASTGLAGKELRVRTLPETALPFVTTVVSPFVRHVAVSDSGKMVVVGHRPKHSIQLSFHRLDDIGQPVAGEPITMALPKPASLANNPHNPHGVVCHPRLPLAYVWQDVEPVPVTSELIDPSLTPEFDHLLIYSLDPEPKLLMATARGPGYASGTHVSGLAMNASGTRLYVPNMQRQDKDKKNLNGVGWIVLDLDGLPPFDPEDAPIDEDAILAAPPVTTPPPDWATASAVHAAKLAAIEQAKAAGKPLMPRRYLETSWTFQTPPSPYNYAPLNDDIVFASTHSGVANWILTDRLGRFGYHYIQPYVPYRYRIAAHPTAPAVYVVPVTYDGRIIRVEHADGYFTLVPQTLSLDGVVYHSIPLVLKTNQVVVGANGKICLIDLEADGRFKASALQMTVNNPTVEGLAWSEKFGRLYVPVEKTP